MRTTQQTRSIVSAAFPEYTGRKVSQDFSGTVRFEDLNWNGGTRSEFRAVRLSDGVSQPLPVAAPWANPIEGAEIAIPAGFAIVRFSTYCGGIPLVRVFYGVVPDPKRLSAGALLLVSVS
jgi:hypothetical protein